MQQRSSSAAAAIAAVVRRIAGRESGSVPDLAANEETFLLGYVGKVLAQHGLQLGPVLRPGGAQGPPDHAVAFLGVRRQEQVPRRIGHWSEASWGSVVPSGDGGGDTWVLQYLQEGAETRSSTADLGRFLHEHMDHVRPVWPFTAAADSSSGSRRRPVRAGARGSRGDAIEIDDSEPEEGDDDGATRTGKKPKLDVVASDSDVNALRSRGTELDNFAVTALVEHVFGPRARRHGSVVGSPQVFARLELVGPPACPLQPWETELRETVEALPDDGALYLPALRSARQTTLRGTRTTRRPRGHWCLVVVVPKSRQILVLDSFVDAVTTMLHRDHALGRLGRVLGPEWTTRALPCQQQRAGSNACGLFMLAFLDVLLLDHPGWQGREDLVVPRLRGVLRDDDAAVETWRGDLLRALCEQAPKYAT